MSRHQYLTALVHMLHAKAIKMSKGQLYLNVSKLQISLVFCHYRTASLRYRCLVSKHVSGGNYVNIRDKTSLEIA